MNDPRREATIATINLLRTNCEYAPKGEEITQAYVDAWLICFQDARLGPQEIVLAAREYETRHKSYPKAATLVQVALEQRDHKNQLATANYYIQPGPALPMGKVTDEDRVAAKARLGIGDEGIRRLEIERRRDRGNVGGELSEGMGSLVDTARQEASLHEARGKWNAENVGESPGRGNRSNVSPNQCGE